MRLRDLLTAGLIASLPVSAAAQQFAGTYHTIDGSQCPTNLQGQDFAAHLRTHRVYPPAVGEQGYAFGDYVFSKSGCDRVRDGALAACTALRADCSNVPACVPVGAGANGGTGGGGLGSGEIAGKAAAQIVMGTPDPNMIAYGGLDLGIAANRKLAQLAAQAKAKRLAEEQARLERGRLAEIERQRVQQEKWRETAGQLRMSASEGELGLRLDDAHEGLGMRFDGSGDRPNPTMDTFACASTLGDCCGRYQPPMAAWTPPYTEPIAFRRGVGVVRRSALPTIYTATEQHAAIVDKALGVAQGCFGFGDELSVDDSLLDLAPNALPLMQGISLERKITRDELQAVTAEHDAKKQQCDDLIGTLSLARADAAAATDPEMKKVLAALPALTKECTAAVAKKKTRVDAAAKKEAAAANKERATFVLLSQPRPTGARGGPVALCSDDQKVVDRLKAGLPTQEKALRKAAAFLDGSREENATHLGEIRNKLIEAAVGKLESVSSDYLEAIENTPATLRKKDIAELVLEFAKLREELGHLMKSGKAGAELGVALAAKSQSLTETAALINRKLGEAGLWSLAGETLAEKTFGPAGKKAFELAELSIDLGAEVGGAASSKMDVDVAKRNLAIMREQYQRVTSTIKEREDAIAAIRREGGCLTGSERNTRP